MILSLDVLPEVEKPDQSRVVARNPWLRIAPVSKVQKSDSFDTCVVRDLYHRAYYEIDIELVELLFSLSENSSRSELVSKISKKFGLSDNDAQDIVTSFEQSKFFLDVSHPAIELFEKTKTWVDFGWAAARDYNAATYNFDYLSASFEDRARDKNMMRKFRELSAPPTPYKKMQGNRIELGSVPESITSASMSDALAPRSFRNNDVALSLDELSAYCFFPFGKTGIKTFHHQGDFLLKCVPSGGARHPVECYMVSTGNEISDGLYHYDVESHALVNIKEKATKAELDRLIYELPIKVAFKPRIVFLLSLIYERSSWRYKESRSYRVVQHDVGHVVETIGCVSNLLGRRYYIGHGFQDTPLEKYCGFGTGEAMSYFVAVG